MLRKLKSKITNILNNFKTAKTQMENDFELVKHGGLFDEYLEMGRHIFKTNLKLQLKKLSFQINFSFTIRFFDLF